MIVYGGRVLVLLAAAIRRGRIVKVLIRKLGGWSLEGPQPLIDCILSRYRYTSVFPGTISCLSIRKVHREKGDAWSGKGDRGNPNKAALGSDMAGKLST